MALNEEQETALTGQPPAEETSEADELQPEAEGTTGVDEDVETDEEKHEDQEDDPDAPIPDDAPAWAKARLSKMASQKRELADKVQAYDRLAGDPEYGKLLQRAAYKQTYGQEMPEDKPEKPAAEEYKPLVNPEDFEEPGEAKLATLVNEVHKALFDTREELALRQAQDRQAQQGSAAKATEAALARYNAAVEATEKAHGVTLTDVQKEHLWAYSAGVGRAMCQIDPKTSLEDVIKESFVHVIGPNAKKRTEITGKKTLIAGTQTGNRGGGSREVRPETLSEKEIMERNYKKIYPSGQAE